MMNARNMHILHYPGRNGTRPLSLAIRLNNNLIFRLLLDARADPNEPDDNSLEALQDMRWTPFLLAVHDGNVDMFLGRQLVEGNPQSTTIAVRERKALMMYVDLTTSHDEGRTPLVLAVRGRNLELIDLSQEEGHDNLSDDMGIMDAVDEAMKGPEKEYGIIK
jgi:ankyrin repeat protein